MLGGVLTERCGVGAYVRPTAMGSAADAVCGLGRRLLLPLVWWLLL